MRTKIKKEFIFQINELNRQDNTNWPNWLSKAWQKNRFVPGYVGPSEYPDSDGKDKLVVNMFSEIILVDWGDYIISLEPIGMSGLVGIWTREFVEDNIEIVP